MSTMTDHRSTSPAPKPPRTPTALAVTVVWAMLAFAVAVIAVPALFDRLTGSEAPVITPTTGGAGTAPAPALEPEPALTAAAVGQPDWPAVVNELLAYDAWLRGHPNPDLVNRYTLESNPDYAEITAAQAVLAAGGQRYDPAPAAPRVSELTLLAHEDGSARLRLSFRTPRYRVVDSAGEIVVDTAARDVATTWDLRYVAGQWRIANAGAAS